VVQFEFHRFGTFDPIVGWWLHGDSQEEDDQEAKTRKEENTARGPKPSRRASR
jgi:hypothetical protein